MRRTARYPSGLQLRQALVDILVKIALFTLQGLNKVLLAFNLPAQFAVLTTQSINLDGQFGDLRNPSLESLKTLIRNHRRGADGGNRHRDEALARSSV